MRRAIYGIVAAFVLQMPYVAWAEGDASDRAGDGPPADGPSSDDLGGMPAVDPSEPAPLVDPALSRGRGSDAFDPTPTPPFAKRNDIPGIVLLGLGAAGVGIGIAGVVVGGHQGTIAERDAASIKKDGGLCQPTTPGFASRCSAVSDAASAHNTWQKVGRGGLAIGVACAVAGIVYLLWPEGRPAARKGSALLLPFAGPGEGGLVLTGAAL